MADKLNGGTVTEEFNIYYNPKTRLWQKEPPRPPPRFSNRQLWIFGLITLANIFIWFVPHAYWKFTASIYLVTFVLLIIEMRETHALSREIKKKMKALELEADALRKDIFK